MRIILNTHKCTVRPHAEFPNVAACSTYNYHEIFEGNLVIIFRVINSRSMSLGRSYSTQAKRTGIQKIRKPSTDVNVSGEGGGWEVR